MYYLNKKKLLGREKHLILNHLYKTCNSLSNWDNGNILSLTGNFVTELCCSQRWEGGYLGNILVNMVHKDFSTSMAFV